MSLFDFFKSSPKSILGIDIGSSAIKMVELEKEEGRYQLKNYALFPLEEYLKNRGHDIGTESTDLPADEIGQIIKKMMKEAEIETRHACFSVPVYSSFSIIIDIPDMPEKEIASAIQFEAKKYIPVPISEVVLDWSIIESPNMNGQLNKQVLLVAVPKEIIERYNKIARLTGLKIKAIEAETFSLGRALVGNDKSSVLLIDAGGRSINVSIIDGGYIRSTNNLEMGGGKITKAIIQKTGASWQAAEELKKKISSGRATESQATELKGIINAMLANIVAEIKKIIEAYQSKYNRRIEKSILAGQGIRVFGFSEYLVNKLGLEGVFANAFARVVHPPLLKPALDKLSPSLAVAVGLAMRN